MKTVTVDFKKLFIRTILIIAVLIMIIPYAFASEYETEYRLEEIVVVATKDSSPIQEVPSSVTALDRDTIEEVGIELIGDAARYVPNINLVEFSERVLSQPYFRGVGAGPINPAVTTYIDGVPQLHGYSSNIEFVDIEQIEFVRGAQGMLYGRNTVGGIIHILSRLPNLESWEYDIVAEYGDYDLMRGQVRLSGPIIEGKLGLSLAEGYASRDGFRKNDITGKDIDNREAFFGKLQLEWLPTDHLSARLILFVERDRDGDYALHDLAALRANPYHVQRNFEGYLDRDIFAPTLALEYSGDKVDFTSITSFVKWDTDGITDLDYTPYSESTREQNIKNTQFTQEFQWSLSEYSSIDLNDSMKLAWQAGALFFTQDYDESSINDIPPSTYVTSTAKLEDAGIGAYAQAILTTREVWDISMGLRLDHEKKDADLGMFSVPVLNTGRDFTEISPQFSVVRRIFPDKMVYGNIGRGYRAGGFNPVSPPGGEAYEEETSWNYEIGAKTTWFDNKLKANLAIFHISWDLLQLNLPLATTYYIANAGDAESTGADIELYARLSRNWDIFGTFGITRTTFSCETLGIDDNDLIYSPEYTASIGTQYSWDIGIDAKVFIRAEVNGYGSYFYNAANTESQSTYWLTNFRAGYRTSHWFAELWIKNAFDEEYIPIAFEFPNYQSGFVGENGSPRMIGIRTGFNF